MDKTVVTQNLQDSSKTEDKSPLPASLFNIVTLEGGALFTNDEETELFRMFGISKEKPISVVVRTYRTFLVSKHQMWCEATFPFLFTKTNSLGVQ
jgi:hypothetical protein